MMIEADSSIAKDGNECFESCALDEFLHSAVLKNPDLVLIRKDILENIYIGDTNKPKKVNTEYLIQLAQKLRLDAKARTGMPPK